MSAEQKIVGIIPARYDSSRFPGKIIADIAGKPMVQRVYENAHQSRILDALWVAVDDQKVFQCVESFGGQAIMTASQHQSGTDRIAEVMANRDGDIVVNIQGDQPLFDARMIDECVQPLLDNPDVLMSTLKTQIAEEEYHDPAIVKVVTDRNGFALYFSRSLIPYPRDHQKVVVYEHVGLYAYRKDFLLTIAKTPQSHLERIERLEQLRVLENGYQIMVVETQCHRDSGLSVDTSEDVNRVAKRITAIEGNS